MAAIATVVVQKRTTNFTTYTFLSQLLVSLWFYFVVIVGKARIFKFVSFSCICRKFFKLTIIQK